MARTTSRDVKQILAPIESRRAKSVRIAHSRLNNAVHAIRLLHYLADKTFDLHPSELVKLLERVQFETDELGKVYKAGSRQSAGLVELR